MEKFIKLQSSVVPLDRGNIDTDQIIPKQFLRSIRKTGFGQFLFDEWRYLNPGELGMDCSKRPKNPDFPLNDERFQNAKILLTQDNFGCGSSREHAVWALMEHGFRAIIAPSFGDIFSNNSVKNGLLLVTLPSDRVKDLLAKASVGQYQLTIDLSSQTISDEAGDRFTFDITADIKKRLSEGLDDIGLTLQHQDAIRNYEQKRREQEPWIFQDFKI